MSATLANEVLLASAVVTATVPPPLYHDVGSAVDGREDVDGIVPGDCDVAAVVFVTARLTTVV
jgi:hypothetical protein